MKPISSLWAGARRALLAPLQLATRSVVRPDDIFGPTRIALYLHFPFCASFCDYCVFNKSHLRRDELLAYVEALEREIRYYGARPQLAGCTVHSIFLGGGTPSVLPADLVERTLHTVRAAFRVEPEVQITLEANPDSTVPEKLARYRRAGVNRISLGVQRFDPAALERLGRKQKAGAAQASIAAVRAAGFTEFSLDLMLGVPGETPEALDRELDLLVGSGATHASIFPLVYRPEAPLWRRRAARHRPYAFYQQAATRLEQAGFRQYSAEDFTRSGVTCRYQDEVWKPGPKGFLGLGAGAMSMYGASSWFNVGPTEAYVAASRADSPPVAGGKMGGTRHQMLEHLMVSARSLRLDPAGFQRRFGVPLARVVGPLPRALALAGLLREEPDGTWTVSRRAAFLTSLAWGELILRQCAEAGRALPAEECAAPPSVARDEPEQPHPQVA